MASCTQTCGHTAADFPFGETFGARPEARRRLSAELILKKIREIKQIEASEDEVKIEVNSIIAAYSSEQVRERLKAKLVPGDTYYEDIKSRLAYRKVVDLFLK